MLRPIAAAMVDTYLANLTTFCEACNGQVTSLILFGSAATGGYSAGISDVDLLVVLRDGATFEDRCRVHEVVAALEQQCGVGKPRSRSHGFLARLTDRITATTWAFFVCSRDDLLSGDPARILSISAVQARFVDRVAIPSIVFSGRTVWGEDLLGRVPLPPIRRLDVWKAFFGLFNQVLLCAGMYPLLDDATKYAMDALKRSVHNCYFCYHGRPARLAEEVAFFEKQHGPSAALSRLMELRTDYRPSYGFVLSSLPAVIRLHARTARENQFPRPARQG